jgi:hypothetical protein
MCMSVSPDQLVAAGAYVARRWGDYGYRFTQITTPAALVSVFTVRCSDGSQMRFAVDRWSNIAELGDDPEAGTATADPSAAASRDGSPGRQTNAT